MLDALCADLAEVCRVKVIAPCSAVTLVGRGMRSLLHKLTDVWSEFGRERVHLISQSSNDLNLTFVLDEALADDLMPRLHELLIHSGAMPVDATEEFGPSWRQIEAAGAPPRKGIAPLVVLVVAGVVATFFLLVGWDAAEAYDELSVGVPDDQLVMGKTEFVRTSMFDGEVLQAYGKDMAFFFGFAALGMWTTLKNAFGAAHA